MTKRNKILFTIVLTVFVALTTCLVASAQAPDIEIDNSSDYSRLFASVYDEQTTDIVMTFYISIDDTTYLTKISCVLTENYFNNYYGSDVDNIVLNRYDIIANTYDTPTTGGAAYFYTDTLTTAFNSYYNLYLAPYGVPVSPFTNQDIINAISIAEYNQFTYWENQFQVQFDNGFAEGQQNGLQTGYNNGYNDGYNDAISDSDAYLEGLFAVFDAPFVFLENLSSFSIFGITIIDVVTFLLIVCFALFIYKIIRRFLPI